MSDLTLKITDPNDPDLSSRQIRRMHLLAASAGTGKTFSIQSLYLRLILVEGLSVQQILVVTFTKDATKELRDRLQSILRGALDYLNAPATIADPTDRTRLIVDAALRQTGGEPLLRQRLGMALLDFDMAAIHTIHGFCQRVLNRFAFETGQAFDVEPASDTSGEIEQLCKDWWRQNIYPLPGAFAEYLSASGRCTLPAITSRAHRLIAKPDANLPAGIEGALGKIEDRISSQVRKVAALPALPAGDLIALLQQQEDAQNFFCAAQQHFQALQHVIEQDDWRQALEVLSHLREMRVWITNPCRAAEAELQKRCNVVSGLIVGARNAGYYVDGSGCLLHGNKPALLPEHSHALVAAIQTLKQRAATCEVLQVIKRRKEEPVKAWQQLEVLQQNLCRVPPVPPEIDLKLLVDAVKAIAKSGSGLKDQVELSLGTLSPAFLTLDAALQAECGQLPWRAALEIRDLYRRGRPAATTASHDDYLVSLRDALRTENNSGLKEVLQKEFSAALIDEFQDTDPIQWGIFERLFAGSETPCFLVGDPKQAIYRFRNGDVETYLEATKSEGPVQACYNLNTNHRSEMRLIDAVNQLFLDDPSKGPTFGAGIKYDMPLSAVGKDADKSLCCNQVVDDRPFKIILIENQSSANPPGKYSPTARSVYRFTAQEIARILTDDSLTVGGQKIRRKDIAVLVNKHDEGELIADELRKLNIPAVRQGTGDVWGTEEGKNLWIFLEAVLDSRNLSHVRHALISNWCGLGVELIQRLNDGNPVGSGPDASQERRMEEWVAVFGALHETWIKRGFPAMLRQLMAKFALKERLLRLTDGQGQRRLANISHLAELVEGQIIRNRKTPEGTLAWVRRQLDRRTADGGDEAKLRLETDDDAVRIMTIFTSKGLEFPIVFAPTLFMMKPWTGGDVREYHDEKGKLHIAGKDDPVGGTTASALEIKEMEREHTRQIYVALTRAVHRTVVVALKNGKEDRTEMGPLDRILRLPTKRVEEAADPAEATSGRKKEKPLFVVDLDRVDVRFGNVDGVPPAVEVVEYTPSVVTGGLLSAGGGELAAPEEKPKADTSKGHGSFTSLAPHGQELVHEPEPAGTGALEADSRNRDRETAVDAAEERNTPPQGIFAFPSGARTGTCWHEIFEDLPFDAGNAAIGEMAREKLRVHGFLRVAAAADERVAVTTEMVKNVLRTGLPALNNASPFALANLPAADRKTEWSFSFPTLSGKRTAELRRVLAGYDEYRPFTENLAWDKPIPGGYLTGFIDLLFRRDGRYYIVDWKSNRRSGTQDDFAQQGLADEIARHGYWLQFLLYTVAVHQYLSRTLPGYGYAEHFGGVYYIFLRGVDGRRDPAGRVNGVYARRPPEKLVNDLSEILGDFA